MELSDETLKGLKLVGDDSVIPSAKFADFVNITFSLVTTETTNADEVPAKSGNAKQALAALVTLILEAAKLNTDGEEIKSTLEDQGVSSDRAKIVGEVYGQRKEGLRILLQRTGFSFPALTGVQWRLDYLVKSRNLDHVNRPLYFVGLQTVKANGEPENIQFSCNLEQLQDLVARLEDATKQVARTVNKR